MSYLGDLSTIVNTKDFRRLHDKTQLFGVQDNDHYRSRITHTIEVNCIALEIAQHLREVNQATIDDEVNRQVPIKSQTPRLILDDTLITAIAIGHDVGHTPFGHKGERVLSDILCGKDNLDGLIVSDKLVKQYFKHNVNSYRVLTRKELVSLHTEPTNDRNGKIRTHSTIISWQVLDGILKHTEVYKNDTDYAKNGVDDPYFLNKSILKDELALSSKMRNALKKRGIQYHKHLVPLTLEGQIVAIADEIAQRVADFDDEVRIKETELVKHFTDIASTNLYDGIQDDLENLKTFLCGENLCDVSNSINRFTQKLRTELIKQVKYYSLKDSTMVYNGAALYLGKFVDLDKQSAAYKISQKLHAVTKEVTACGIAATKDKEAEKIIHKLFAYYYNNLDKLPENYINYFATDLFNKLTADFDQEVSSKVVKMQLPTGVKFDRLASNISIEKKVKFIRVILQIIGGAYYQQIESEVNSCFGEKSSYATVLLELSRDEQLHGLEIDKTKVSEQYKKRQESAQRAYSIVLNNIAYYIAGMTDGFATKQYNEYAKN